MTKRILITGSNGFLGRYILEYLKQNNVVETLGRSSKSNFIFDLALEVPQVGKDYDIIIHAAGKAHSVPATQRERQTFFDVNVKGTQNLLEGLEKIKSKPGAFVFISSVSVYGIESGDNYSEEAPLLAKDPYGLSKIQSEQYVIDWCKKNDIICTILRLPLVVGTNPQGNLKSMIVGIKKRYYFNVAGGTVKKSMVLASDVAQCILKVSEFGGIYNLTDGYHPTFYELSRTISMQMGVRYIPNIPRLVAILVAKLGDLIGNNFPFNSNKLNKIMSPLTFDDTKAREAFGWHPTPVLEGFKISDKN